MSIHVKFVSTNVNTRRFYKLQQPHKDQPKIILDLFICRIYFIISACVTFVKFPVILQSPRLYLWTVVLWDDRWWQSPTVISKHPKYTLKYFNMLPIQPVFFMFTITVEQLSMLSIWCNTQPVQLMLLKSHKPYQVLAELQLWPNDELELLQFILMGTLMSKLNLKTLN